MRVFLVYCEEQREGGDRVVVDSIFARIEDAENYSRDRNVHTHFSHIEEWEITDSFDPPNAQITGPKAPV
jgi:hypothetical protein